MPWVNNAEIPKDAKVRYCFAEGEGKPVPWHRSAILQEGKTWREKDLLLSSVPYYIGEDVGKINFGANATALCTVLTWGGTGDIPEFIHINSVVDLRMVDSMRKGYDIGVELYSDALSTIEYLMEALEVRDARATTIVDNEGVARPGTCLYCGARLYLGEKHREEANEFPACPTESHPIKEGRNEEDNTDTCEHRDGGKH